MVRVPPRMAAKPMGMSSREMGMSWPRLMRCTAGKNRAAAPTFCMMLLIRATVAEMSTITRLARPPARRRAGLTKRPTRPVRSRPPQ